MKPLKDIIVLDLTRVLSGPYSTMMLADFGANIYKIEPPKGGDDSRAFGPFIGKESAYFMSLNRNKRSMVLDFKNPKHVAVFKEMVKKADLLVENYRPLTMEKFGLGYDELHKINPRLVYVACSGFGGSGPYMLKPAYDVVVQAMGGIMSITGEEGGQPTRVGSSIGDVTAGIFSAYGALLALYDRDRTGIGHKVDISMLDCQVAILENAIARYLTTGSVPCPLGNRHPSISPFSSFPAKDGHVIIGIANDKLWSKFCSNVLNRPELIADPRFVSNSLRTENYKDVHAILNEIIPQKTIQEWLDILDKEGIPCAPINTIDRLLADPQVLSRNMIVEVDHPVAGKMKMPGTPVKITGIEIGDFRPAPLLGEHTNELLHEMFGWDDNTIKENLG